MGYGVIAWQGSTGSNNGKKVSRDLSSSCCIFDTGNILEPNLVDVKFTSNTLKTPMKCFSKTQGRIEDTLPNGAFGNTGSNFEIFLCSTATDEPLENQHKQMDAYEILGEGMALSNLCSRTDFDEDRYNKKSRSIMNPHKGSTLKSIEENG